MPVMDALIVRHKDGLCVFSFQVSTGAYTNQVFVVPAGNGVEDEAIISKITWNSWTR